jgi:hypothetical protein
VDENVTLMIEDAIPVHTIQNSLQYSLHAGNNLISYPFDVDQDLDGIDGTGLLGISGEGVAAINI